MTGGNVRPPRKLRDVRPVYPAHLATKGVGGTVLLEARIGTDGFVREVTVVETGWSTNAAGTARSDTALADFGKAAADAVRQWQFDSTLLNCVATEVAMMVRVTFEID